jgi:hypothetical protein
MLGKERMPRSACIRHENELLEHAALPGFTHSIAELFSVLAPASLASYGCVEISPVIGLEAVA